MGNFTLRGDYSNEDVVPEQGTITVTPSVLPLVSIVDGKVIRSPLIGKIDQGLFSLELPALGDFEPEFSLGVELRFNSGATDSFEMMPMVAGYILDISQVTPIPTPVLPGEVTVLAAGVLTNKDDAQAAAGTAVDAATLSVAAQNASIAARDVSVTARTGSEAARNAAQTAATNAAASEGSVSASAVAAASSKTGADAAANAASASQGAAATSAAAASASEVAAKTSETNAGTQATNAANTAAQTKIDAHVAATDPHSQYETNGEAAAKVAAHEGASNPHSQYPLKTPFNTQALRSTHLNLPYRTDSISASRTGALVVEMNVDPTAGIMVQVDLDLFTYTSGVPERLEVHAACYAQSSGTTIGHASVRSHHSFRAIGPWSYPKVRWIRSIDKTKLYLVIGEVTDAIAYPNAIIRQVTSHYFASSISSVLAPTLVTVLPEGTSATVVVVDEVGTYRGVGSPEGLVQAPIGSRYIDTSGTNGAIEWMKLVGTSTVGWRTAYGDTGRRTVTNLVNAPATTSSFTLQRVGSVVYFAAVTAFPASWTAGNVLFTLPLGFRPTANHNIPSYSGSGPLSLSTTGAAALWAAPPVNNSLSWSTSFITTDAWPIGALPGAAG